MTSDTLKGKGSYRFEIVGADGKVRDSWKVDNLITSAGKAQIALLIGDAAAVPFTYMAVGTSSTATNVSQTALGAEITDTGLSRAAGTVSRVTTSVTNDTYQITHTWTASGSKTLEEVGLFNANSSGTMLGRALTTTKTIVNGETFTATYSVQFS